MRPTPIEFRLAQAVDAVHRPQRSPRTRRVTLTPNLLFARNVRALTIGAICGTLALAAPSRADADADACGSQPAHATIVLGPNTYVESAGADYASGGCGRFVVDLEVEPEVHAHLDFRGQLAASALNQWSTIPAASYPLATSCDQYSQTFTVYRRLEDGSFVEVSSALHRGEEYFDSTYALRCRLVWSPRGSTLNPPPWQHSYFGHSWRVAFSARFGNQHRPVRVHASTW